jgi:hypothetical protein
VPPETIKNVAATKGHNVSLMDVFLGPGGKNAERDDFSGAVKGSDAPNFYRRLRARALSPSEFAIAE